RRPRRRRVERRRDPAKKKGEDTHGTTLMNDKNTGQEAAFLIEELALAPGASLLDVGCGTGRHFVARKTAEPLPIQAI
ncbi:MAG: hypothetical protein AAB578_04345, partial [Elusimicrobiota bacterium]